jgi:hypothetical protein
MRLRGLTGDIRGWVERSPSRVHARWDRAVPIIDERAVPKLMGIARNERHGENRDAVAALHPSYAAGSFSSLRYW